jgi:RNA polymerase primary sigma factor
MAEIVSRWKATSMEMSYRLGRQPTSAEIAEELELPESNWDVVRDTVLANSQPTYSMNEDASSILADHLEDSQQKAPEEILFASLEVRRMIELLDVLEPRERKILRMRYGLDNGKPMTLKAIGERIGLTRERVRQMEQEALRRLRATMAREFGEEAPGPQARQRKH